MGKNSMNKCQGVFVSANQEPANSLGMTGFPFDMDGIENIATIAPNLVNTAHWTTKGIGKQ